MIRNTTGETSKYHKRNYRNTGGENTKAVGGKNPVELGILGASFDGKLASRLQINDLAAGLSRSLNID